MGRHLAAVGILMTAVVELASAEETLSRQAGKSVGEFGVGVGQAIGSGLADGMHLEWETVAPRSKEQCLLESGGVVNPVFVRCRNGRQEQVRYSNGRRIVVRERPIPMQ